MSIIGTGSTYSTNTLQSIYSAFSNNLDYSSIEYFDGTNTQRITLVSFLANPNFSGYNFPQNMLPTIYDGFKNKLNRFISDVSNNSVSNYDLGIITKFRILVTISDGTVFFDSSKGASNTYSNFLAKTINENHATRKYIQQSMHSKDGIGYESKWSSSTQAVDTYYSVRYGFSTSGILGIIAFSYSNNL